MLISGCKILFFLCFLPIVAAAQYRFDSWTTDKGLPQNSVYSIVHTRDGYIWLATVDGLARFDGVRFTVFNKSNSPGIANNRFNSLFEDSSGELWAGTEGSGVVRYSNGRFSGYGKAEGIPRGIVWISGDADGKPIFHSHVNETFHFSGGRFSPLDWAANSSKDSPVVRPRSAGLLCLGPKTDGSFDCFTDGRLLELSPGPGLPPYKLLTGARDAEGNIWLLTTDRELLRVENGNVVRVFNNASGLPKRPLRFITGVKTSLLSSDGADSLWLTNLTTMQNELLVGPQGGVPRASRDIYPLFAEDGPPALSAYQDGEGNLWFGTLRAGLYRARKQVVTSLSTAEGLADNNVYPVFQDPDGPVWVGAQHGLYTYQNGRFSVVPSTENFDVGSIGKLADGRMIITSSGILFVQEGDRFVRFLGQAAPMQGITAIHIDREGALWAGGENRVAYLKDSAVATFTPVNGLAGDSVRVIIDASAGGVWIGSYGGLSRFQNEQLTRWTEADGLPSRTIRSLYEDADGTLWIGTYDGGLARFRDGKFTHYNTKIGLHNDGVFQILEDGRRWFWMSSNRGIYRVNKDELNEFADGKRKTITSIVYGKSDGMLNVECNGGGWPAGTRTLDGRFWFPTQDGVVVIDPSEITINSRPPPVVIEGVRIGDQSVDPEAFNSAIVDPGSPIRLEPDQQNFEIHYTALSFINSENLRFRYRLEGLEDEWTDALNRRTAYFSHVPPGEFVFRVIAANSDGVWNETGKTLKIVVLPPFYRTYWFMGLSILCLGMIGFVLYQRHVSGLKRKHVAQEEFSRRLINAHESERRRIAAELHDSLGQSLAMIKNSAVFGSQTAKDLSEARGHLTEISTQSAHAISDVREITYNLRPYLLDRLGLTKAISSLLNRIADNSAFIIISDIENVDGLFENDAEISIYRIIQESLNNVLKHAEASEVKLSISKTERRITIKISDNGRGFDVKAKGEERTRAGFGLLGMTERVRMLAGTISIESAMGKGTKIEIELWANG